MKVRLLAQHNIGDRLYERDSIVDVDVVTPYMEGLDDVARTAIYAEKVRVFGRWKDWEHTTLLDDPPIPRPLEENQPVPNIPARVPR